MFLYLFQSNYPETLLLLKSRDSLIICLTENDTREVKTAICNAVVSMFTVSYGAVPSCNGKRRKPNLCFNKSFVVTFLL